MTAKELAKSAGCSTSWVYKLAQKLKRLPTLQELAERKNRRGRPKKYNNERS